MGRTDKTKIDTIAADPLVLAREDSGKLAYG